MTTSTTMTSTNFSPDGMRGGAMDRRHETGHRDQHSSTRSSDKIEHDQSHDHYDDGLVHDHSWHSTSNTR
jgi:hypothetical protein